MSGRGLGVVLAIQCGRRPERRPNRICAQAASREGHAAISSSHARHRLPPARSRSTSSGVWAPKSLATEPLGHLMIVPPVVLTILAPGLWALRPEGPEKQAVAASPRVGAMMPTQWGMGPGMHAGPLT